MGYGHQQAVPSVLQGGGFFGLLSGVLDNGTLMVGEERKRESALARRHVLLPPLKPSALEGQ